ncbi:hypothetical protein AKUA1404_09380 [Apilactobacillus kunkeei]|nr:hypothetical protein AKUA1404_09380 [Apilactobacillus kunkeei]
MISMENNETTPKYFIQVQMQTLKKLGLTSTDKLVYGTIYTMLNVTGKCFMSNASIAESIEIKPKTVSKSISKLSELGLINVKLIYKEDSKQIDKRYITLSDYSRGGMLRKSDTLSYQSSIPMLQKSEDNRLLNKSINRLNNNMSSSNEHDHSEAKEIIAYLNDKADKHFRNTQSNYKRIEARLKDYSIDDLKHVIDNKCASWLNTNMDKYLRIETLFRASKIDGYLNEKVDTRNTGGEVHGIDF